MSERVVPDAASPLSSPSRSSSAHIVPNSTLTTGNGISHLDSCKPLFAADHIANDDRFQGSGWHPMVQLP